MIVVHVNDRGTRRPRYFVAVTDGDRDHVYAASSPQWIAEKLERVLGDGGPVCPPETASGGEPVCANGQLAGELLPSTIRRETVVTPEMARAGQLLLVAEMVAEHGIDRRPSVADRELARVPDLYAKLFGSARDPQESRESQESPHHDHDDE